MQITNLVSGALTNIITKFNLPTSQLDYVQNQKLTHPNDFLFYVFDVNQIGVLTIEHFISCASLFELTLSVDDIQQMIQLISFDQDDPIDLEIFDRLLILIREIGVKIGCFW